MFVLGIDFFHNVIYDYSNSFRSFNGVGWHLFTDKRQSMERVVYLNFFGFHSSGDITTKDLLPSTDILSVSGTTDSKIAQPL